MLTRENLWLEFLSGEKLCGLCGNTGYVDTRGKVYSPAGVECGVRRCCICPNGREQMRHGSPGLDANILVGAQIGERFITAADERMLLVRDNEAAGEYRYLMIGEDGEQISYNAAGTPLIGYAARRIVRKYRPFTPTYAEVPLLR